MLTTFDSFVATNQNNNISVDFMLYLFEVLYDIWAVFSLTVCPSNVT